MYMVFCSVLYLCMEAHLAAVTDGWHKINKYPESIFGHLKWTMLFGLDWVIVASSLKSRPKSGFTIAQSALCIATVDDIQCAKKVT